MRISIVMGFFLPVPAVAGGAMEKIWGKLAGIFAAQGHDVTVVSRTWPGFADCETAGRLTHLRIPGRDHTRSLPRNLWRDFLWGRRVARALPPGDLVVCNTVSLPFLIAGRRPDLGRVAVVLGRMPKGQVRVYGKLDLILATSQAVAEKAVAENPRVASRIAVLRQSIDWTGLQRRARKAGHKGQLTIGYVGRIHPEKGLEQLLDAAVGLKERSSNLPDWKLVLMGPVEIREGGGGPGYLASLQSRYHPLLGQRLEFRAPSYDREALNDVYGSLDIFCYPSLAALGEGLSVAPLEAMAAGAAPVLSNLDCYRDVIVPGSNGLQFDHTAADRTRQLEDCLRRLLGDSDLRATIAARAQESVRCHDFEATAGDLLTHFARLTGLPAQT
ncbi:MAG: glycosyltransferase family 4 protein [Opitutaceae bacterium]|nr:glycosyltransferase family 4 protein [Opitutaceae bacterium]